MTERKLPSRSAIRLRAVSHRITWFLGTRFPGAIPLVFVVGYPKSGTTWFCQLAADYLQLPFPRFSLLPVGCPAVVHGHELATSRYPRGAYIMRDGRDALTSLYFFAARRLPAGDRPQLTRAQRRMFPGLINRDDVRRNFAPFIERQMMKPVAVPLNWGEHVSRFFELKHPRMALVRYEDLRADGERSLAAAMTQLDHAPADMERIRAALDKFSFERQAGRKAGSEDRTSFLRKGEVGDWRNHFNVEAAEIFDRHCGRALVQAGYEPDCDWVDRFRREVSEMAEATPH